MRHITQSELTSCSIKEFYWCHTPCDTQRLIEHLADIPPLDFYLLLHLQQEHAGKHCACEDDAKNAMKLLFYWWEVSLKQM